MAHNSPAHDFDALAPYYDRGLKILLFTAGGEARLRKKIVAFLESGDLKKGARILEVGCGTGSNMKALDDDCPNCFQMYGLDYSLPMLREALGKNFSLIGGFIGGDAAKLPFPDRSFEAVLAVFTLHEISQAKRESAVSEMDRALKRGGKALIVDLAYPSTAAGKLLFSFLGIIESEEAVDFIKGGTGKLLARHGFQIEKRETFYFGLVELSLFRKKD